MWDLIVSVPDHWLSFYFAFYTRQTILCNLNDNGPVFYHRQFRGGASLCMTLCRLITL